MKREDIFQEDPRGRNPLALEQGTLVRDQFRLGRVLGVGGFGITYLAFDEVLEMVVAVKEYLPNNIAVRESGSQTVQPFSQEERSDFEFGLKRFLREARMLAKFEEHPNIVRVRTFFEANGTGYLVMNYYEGRTLREYLGIRNDFILESEGLLLMDEVLEGLAAVHEKEILHRDIDPSNVYLADNGKVVLLDFGAARAAVGERTQDMSVVLKRGYAPYEQYHSQGDQGPWTDVYACSATLYRALTGYKPPEATARVMDDELVPPKELVPSLSDATNDAVVHGLAVQPDDRPQSIEEFARLLPDTSSETVPGWEMEGMGEEVASAAPDGATAGLELTASHDCRVYVDGMRRAEVPAGKTRTVDVEEGTHRLRAVRIDRPTSDSATVTMSRSKAGDADVQASSVGLGSILWKTVVTVSANGSTALTIDFGGNGLPDPHPGGDNGRPAQEHRSNGAGESPPIGAPEAPGGRAIAGVGAEAAEDGSGSGALSFMRVWSDQPCDLIVNGIPETSLDTEVDQWVAVRPGKHKVRAEAIGGTAVWEHDIKTEPNGSTTVTVALDRTARTGRDTALLDSVPSLDAVPTEPVLRWLRTHPQRWAQMVWGRVSSYDLRIEVIGVLALLLMTGLVWSAWPGSGEATPGGGTAVAPKIQLQSDRVVTMGETTVNVLANDEGPDRVAMGLTSARALSAGIESVDVIDAARLRVVPAPDFVGTADVEYRVSTVQGTTAHATLTVAVPFSVGRHVVTREAEGPQVVHAVPLTESERPDLVVASYDDNSVGWMPNLESPVSGSTTSSPSSEGSGSTLSSSGAGGGFGPYRSVTASADGALTVETADLSGNRRPDLLFGAERGDRVAWVQNRGQGEFGPPQPITATATGVIAADAADITGNGRADVVIGARRARRVTWRRNLGDGDFGPPRTLVSNVRQLGAVHVADITADGHPDVIVASFEDDTIFWFKNQGRSGPLQFGRRRTLSTNVEGPINLHTADLSGNGQPDVVASAASGGSVVWFENRRTADGRTTFSGVRPVAEDVHVIEDLTSADLDEDGDQDLVAAAFDTNAVLWLENVGGGTFDAPHVIDRGIVDPVSVDVVDVDGDGDLDVLSAAQGSDHIALHENYVR